MQVQLPVRDRGPVPVVTVGHEAAEGLAGVGDDFAVALEQEHAGVERPFDVVAVGRLGDAPNARDEAGA